MKKILWVLLLVPLTSYASFHIWQEVPDINLFRTYVPHGWLVYKEGYSSGLTFYPDEKHEWKI